MKWTSVLAIYFLWFCFIAFAMLPFGVKTSEEVGEELVPGQAPSAPYRFDLKRHLIRAALVSAVATALFVANYIYEWVSINAFDFYN
nr:DUF1467 family protein [uncultured Sphingomonas sp.]